MLCAHAQFRLQPNRFAASAPLSTYLTSATSCPECDFLLRIVEEFKPGWIGENKGPGLIEVAHKAGRRRRIVPATVNLLVCLSGLGTDLPEDRRLVDSFQYFRRSKEEPMYENSSASSSESVLYQTLDITNDTRSQAAFDRAAKWLSYCLDHDVECKAPISNFMPRRLINVGSRIGTGEPFLFEPVEAAPYVCLSYCWGPNVESVLKTTRENIDSHYQAIPFSLLPQTICDAITCCRGLNIPNLWIDSLCIIQDDLESWLHDSAQMHDIYLNSHLTIAAQEPASCKLGFLGAQIFGNTDWQRAFITDVPAKVGGPAKEIFIRPGSTPFEDLDDRCSLDKRGWCLQESILPNRRLCFNGNEMIWECLCRKLCECGHTLWAPRSVSFEILGASIKSKSSRPYDSWRALVEEYTDRSLTRTTDKLSAVSGLAKTISDLLYNLEEAPDTYLAGLWRREFLSDLSWCVLSVKQKPQGTQTYRAPSWSWASVDGSVRYEFLKTVLTWKYKAVQEQACTVNEVICRNMLLLDPTSPVTAAHAVLTGPLAPVELVVLDETLSDVWKSDVQRGINIPVASKQRSLVRSENLCSLEVFLDHLRETNLSSGDAKSECWIEGRCGKQCCHRNFQNPADQRNEEESPFYCFRLFTWTAAGNLDDLGRRRMIGPETVYLLLQRSFTTEETFERIGVGVWTPSSERRSWAQQNGCPLFDACKPVTIKIV